MSSVIRQFRVWLNSPATLTSAQPFWIDHFPQALWGNTEKTAPLNGTFYVPLASQMNTHKMRGENRDTRSPGVQGVSKFKKMSSSLSPSPPVHLLICPPLLLSKTFTLRWIIYLSSLFHASLSGFSRFLGQIWRSEVRLGRCLNKGLKQSQLQPDQIFTLKRNVIPDWKQACCSSCGNYNRFTYAYHFLLSTSFFVFHALSKSCTLNWN